MQEPHGCGRLVALLVLAQELEARALQFAFGVRHRCVCVRWPIACVPFDRRCNASGPMSGTFHLTPDARKHLMRDERLTNSLTPAPNSSARPHTLTRVSFRSLCRGETKRTARKGAIGRSSGYVRRWRVDIRKSFQGVKRLETPVSPASLSGRFTVSTPIHETKRNRMMRGINAPLISCAVSKTFRLKRPVVIEQLAVAVSKSFRS